MVKNKTILTFLLIKRSLVLGLEFNHSAFRKAFAGKIQSLH